MDEDPKDVLGSQLDDMANERQKARAQKSLHLIRRKSGVNVGEAERVAPRQFTTAIELLKEIKLYQDTGGQQGVNPKILTSKQRRACELELDHTGMRPVEMASLFGVSKELIRKDWIKIRKDMGIALQDYNPQQFVAWFLEQAAYHQAVFKKTGKLEESWKIVQALASQLTNWGMVVPLEQLQRLMGGGRMEKQVGDEPTIESLSDDQLRRLEAIVNEQEPTGTDGPDGDDNNPS